MYKILIVGDSAVGKTSLLTRVAHNTFIEGYTSTNNITNELIAYDMNGTIVNFNIYDTDGHSSHETEIIEHYMVDGK